MVVVLFASRRLQEVFGVVMVVVLFASRRLQEVFGRQRLIRRLTAAG
ncbi:MAG: hypothetical protein ACYTF5_21260 [Planctomycetota bacterium]